VPWRQRRSAEPAGDQKNQPKLSNSSSNNGLGRRRRTKGKTEA
jgi:hypothetical protein